MKINLELPPVAVYETIPDSESAWKRWRDKSSEWVRIIAANRGAALGRKCLCHLSVLKSKGDAGDYPSRLDIKIVGEPDPNYREGALIREIKKGRMALGEPGDVFFSAFPISQTQGGITRWLIYRVKLLPEKRLYLIRGISGAGKSTLAREISGVGAIAADDFPGLYEGGYQTHLVSKAHQWCFQETEKMMVMGMPSIAVHNTFVKVEWMEPYLSLARRYGYRATVLRVEGRHHNLHEVPPEVVKAQWLNFEDYEEF